MYKYYIYNLLTLKLIWESSTTYPTDIQARTAGKYYLEANNYEDLYYVDARLPEEEQVPVFVLEDALASKKSSAIRETSHSRPDQYL